MGRMHEKIFLTISYECAYTKRNFKLKAYVNFELNKSTILRVIYFLLEVHLPYIREIKSLLLYIHDITSDFEWSDLHSIE